MLLPFGVLGVESLFPSRAASRRRDAEISFRCRNSQNQRTRSTLSHVFLFVSNPRSKATHYIDSKEENVAAALQALGGAKIVLNTAPSAEAAGACIDGGSHSLQCFAGAHG